jgi:hypothetical protein
MDRRREAVVVSERTVFLIVSAVLIWEAAMLFLSWRLGVSNFSSFRFERSVNPKGFWTLFLVHAVLLGMVFIAVVLLWTRAKQ